MIRAIALDDEILALRIIENYADKIENLTLEKVFNKQSDAQKHLNKFPVDLIFLDIEMPAKNGLDFYKNISQNTKVIFTTAYSEYAVDAFSVNAVDYLLKPFSFERFKTAVEKVKSNTENNDAKHLSIRADYKLHKINFNDIQLIEGLDDYIQIHLKDSTKITARSSMKSILEKLSEKDFVRVHRSFIVPVNDIKTIVNKNIHIGDFIIPIGETYKEEVMKNLNR
ncbi:LytR/AlgR family response regulator transcription factor [Chryseobacterium luquanense]|uniref:LytTR family DNA-binding domain-containing protein n=1 Tax=Chryseobacterium luquanense TaxID=2983766 RepID=A0ABT3Y1I3_9FLAO|nr:LytTR family DNA-binding domain-containing protein [Chryseobacterium luquanense]MCX8531983.1 LytTR family DNA-binding domain-containing protein [Chryseobacterium luquanense]